jgi:hypothetical protein
MVVRLSQGIPDWVACSVEHACRPASIRESRILDSPGRGRWDISVELENGTEILAWVERFEQTPAGVSDVIRQALEDAGVSA